MQFSRFAPIAAAAALLVTLACDETPEALSPTDGLSFAAGGKSDNRSASGHAVALEGTQEYTFTANRKKGEVTGQIDLLFHLPAGEFFMKADVTCLIVVPGTTHAAITAHVTSTNVPGSGATDMAWNVTDGGPVDRSSLA
jgi:hypothetical protein